MVQSCLLSVASVGCRPHRQAAALRHHEGGAGKLLVSRHHSTRFSYYLGCLLVVLVTIDRIGIPTWQSFES